MNAKSKTGTTSTTTTNGYGDVVFNVYGLEETSIGLQPVTGTLFMPHVDQKLPKSIPPKPVLKVGVGPVILFNPLLPPRQAMESVCHIFNQVERGYCELDLIERIVCVFDNPLEVYYPEHGMFRKTGARVYPSYASPEAYRSGRNNWTCAILFPTPTDRETVAAMLDDYLRLALCNPLMRIMSHPS